MQKFSICSSWLLYLPKMSPENHWIRGKKNRTFPTAKLIHEAMKCESTPANTTWTSSNRTFFLPCLTTFTWWHFFYYILFPVFNLCSFNVANLLNVSTLFFFIFYFSHIAFINYKKRLTWTEAEISPYMKVRSILMCFTQCLCKDI